jgi:predicted  nucleic acid-binding Zn-ribbon protein
LACKDCGQVIDPFDWLLNVARRADRFDTQYRELRAMIEEKQKKLAAVLKEVSTAERKRDGLKQEIAELSKQLRFEFGLPEAELQRIKERLR